MAMFKPKLPKIRFPKKPNPAQPTAAPAQSQQSAQPQQNPSQPQQPQQAQKPQQPQQPAQPQQSTFERRASGNNPVSNVLNFAGQNRATAQNQAQMQAQQQQAQFLQQQQSSQQPAPQQPQQAQQGQAPQQQMQQGQQPNRYSNLQQRMDGQQQAPQQGQPQMEQGQEEMQAEEPMQQQGTPQMPKQNVYGQAQGLAGQAAGLTGTAAGLSKLAGFGGMAGKLGGAAGTLGAATQGLGAFNALASGDKVGGVDQMAGMAANFIPGIGPLGGAAYNMIPENIRKGIIGGGLKVAGQLGMDSNVLNVNQPGKMAEGLGKTALNLATGGKVGQQVLKSVTKSLPKISAPKIKVCHLAGTPVKMADGSIKNIEDLKLGDVLELGGTVLARGEAIQGEQVYDYNGIFVTGSHAVCENGIWMRVEDSQNSVPVSVDGLVYPLSTEENLIVTANGQVWADMNEVENTYDLTDTQIIDILNSQEERNSFLKEYMDATNTKVQSNGLFFATRVVF